MTLIVDSREKKEVRKWLFQKGVRYSIKALKTGDYLFYDGDESNRVLVERKTVADLVSSYRDGRLKSQFKRMSEEKYPMLLVTGTIKDVEKYVKVDKYIVQHVISDAMIKYGFRGVIWVLGDGESPHKEGLILLSDMMKNLELGNLDAIKAVDNSDKGKSKGSGRSKGKSGSKGDKELEASMFCKKCGSELMISATGRIKLVCSNIDCK